MEQHAQTEVELNEEELQDVNGGDSQNVGATVGTGLAGTGIIAGTIGYFGHKIHQEVKATRLTTEIGNAHLDAIKNATHHTAVEVLKKSATRRWI